MIAGNDLSCDGKKKRYSTDNDKHNAVVDTEDWCLTVNIYMKGYKTQTRDKRHCKVDNGKIYNLMLRQRHKGLKEELNMLDEWRQMEKDQDSPGLLTMIKDSMHGLKQKKFEAMTIMECEYELNTITQAPRDTIKWFHMMSLVQLETSRAHGEILWYHPVLVEHSTLRY